MHLTHGARDSEEALDVDAGGLKVLDHLAKHDRHLIAVGIESDAEHGLLVVLLALLALLLTRSQCAHLVVAGGGSCRGCRRITHANTNTNAGPIK